MRRLLSPRHSRVISGEESVGKDPGGSKQVSNLGAEPQHTKSTADGGDRSAAGRHLPLPLHGRHDAEQARRKGFLSGERRDRFARVRRGKHSDTFGAPASHRTNRTRRRQGGPARQSNRIVSHRVVPFRAVPCRAVLCGAVPRRVALRRVASRRVASRRVASRRVALSLRIHSQHAALAM
jgi:hypothetical protein